MEEQIEEQGSYFFYFLGHLFSSCVLIPLFFALQWAALSDISFSNILDYFIFGMTGIKILFVPATIYVSIVGWVIKKMSLRRSIYGAIASIVINNVVFIICLSVFTVIIGENLNDSGELITYFFIPITLSSALISFLLPAP